MGVSQQGVSNRLREMGKIQKTEKWVPHELNKRQTEKRKITCDILFVRYKRKSSLHRVVTGNEKWISFENPKRKKSWVGPCTPTASTANLIALTERRCSVFDGTRAAWSIMSC